MKKVMLLGLAAVALALAGCETPRERGAVGGAVIGAGTGAVLGSVATGGRSGGAWAGALLGGATGAYVGAESAPRGGGNCYQDQYGRRYCENVRYVQPQQQYYARPAPRCYRDAYGYRYCE